MTPLREAILCLVATASLAACAPLRHETRDRTTEASMTALAGGPFDEYAAGKVEEAKAHFESLLRERERRYGPRSLEVADTIQAFGVLLANASENADEDALLYLKRAIAAQKAHFGPVHPEVALALTDYGQVLMRHTGDKGSPEAAAAFEEAYRIRLATLGDSDGETGMSLLDLGAVLGRPSMTHGEDLRIEAAVDTLERGAAILRRSHNSQKGEAQSGVFKAAWAYLINDRPVQAVARFQAYAAECDRLDLSYSLDALRFAKRLEKMGHTKEAAAFRRQYDLATDVTEPFADVDDP